MSSATYESSDLDNTGSSSSEESDSEDDNRDSDDDEDSETEEIVASKSQKSKKRARNTTTTTKPNKKTRKATSTTSKKSPTFIFLISTFAKGSMVATKKIILSNLTKACNLQDHEQIIAALYVCKYEVAVAIHAGLLRKDSSAHVQQLHNVRTLVQILMQQQQDQHDQYEKEKHQQQQQQQQQKRNIS